MNTRTAFAAGAAGAALVLSAFVGSTLFPTAIVPLGAVAGTVHFTAVGDVSSSAAASAMLSQVGAARPDAHFTLGDLSYGATGAEQTWCDFVTTRVGAGFPFETISGNHESNGLNGNINDFTACLPNQLPGVVGSYGRQYYVDVPQVNPLVRFIMVSPELTFVDGVWSYAAGTPRYQWTSNAIDGARGAGIPWVVVGMHKQCISVGRGGCESGADLMNLLVSKRVDLVLTGHEHNYARSKQLALGASCTAIVPGTFTAGCVADGGNALVKGAGTVFNTVGTGGTPLRDLTMGDPEAPYFAASAGLNANPTFGNLDVSTTADRLTARFLPVLGGTFTDAFTISAGATPINQPPVASFTAACTALECSVNASASSDPDGSITNYAWNWGDGAEGTGATAAHSFATAGSYTVTLTVTDNASATGSTTRPVVVGTGTPPFAADSFSRSVTNGLGTAEAGGAWSTTGSSTMFSVDGAARIRVATAGVTASAYLAQLSQAQTDFRFILSSDKVATGGGTFISASGRRIVGVGAYQAKIVLRSSGLVALSLVRVNGSGAGEVVLQPAISVPGLTLAAGDRLNVRVQVTGANPTTVQAKVWPVNGAEPTAWQRTITDATAGLQTAGGLGITLYISSSATNTPVVGTIDDLIARIP